MSLTERCLKYFEHFSNQDMKALKSDFAEDVVLRDWEINAEGREEVLRANKNIFDGVRNIKIKTLKSFESPKGVANEIEVHVNDSEEILLVVDIIEFNDSGKITSIRAYKG